MFFELPHQQLGFMDSEWDEMTPGDKRLIRDFALNGYNETRTVLYDHYEDDTRLRKVIHKYDLNNRPKIHVSFTSVHFY